MAKVQGGDALVCIGRTSHEGSVVRQTKSRFGSAAIQEIASRKNEGFVVGRGLFVSEKPARHPKVMRKVGLWRREGEH